MFDRGADQVVAGTERTVVIDQELRHQEQRDALQSRRGIRQAGQHEVDDVLGDVMLAPGDEDLGAADQVGAVADRLGLGRDSSEVGAGVRLGQVHRAGPGAFDHLRQVLLLQFVGSVVSDGFDGAAGQHRAQAEGHVGALPHFIDGHRHHSRQALAAVLRSEGHGHPAGFGEQFVGFLEAFGGGHHAVLADVTDAVADLVDRIEHAGGKFGGFVENGFDQLDRAFLVARQGADFFEAGDFIEDELHVADRGDIGTHVRDSF